MKHNILIVSASVIALLGASLVSLGTGQALPFVCNGDEDYHENEWSDHQNAPSHYHCHGTSILAFNVICEGTHHGAPLNECDSGQYNVHHGPVTPPDPFWAHAAGTFVDDAFAQTPGGTGTGGLPADPDIHCWVSDDATECDSDVTGEVDLPVGVPHPYAGNDDCEQDAEQEDAGLYVARLPGPEGDPSIPAVWMESNGEAGLQCTPGGDGGQSDTRLL